MKKQFWLSLLIAVFITTAVYADQDGKEQGIFSGIMRLEGRGFANFLLFPLEYGHFPKSETKGGIGYFSAWATHTVTRVFSGISDIVFLPLIYPFSKYDDSIPVGMGWGEYPWDKPIEE